MTSPASPPSRPSGRKPRRRRWIVPALFGLGALGGGSLAAAYALGAFGTGNAKRPDLLLHRVKFEALPIAVVEKGTLESADNREVICKVKAGSKGTYASTIKWVIDDGSTVTKGQPLLELDDSALQDSHKNQSIVVEKARAEFVKADEEYTITVKQNEADIASAEAAYKVAELDLDKFLGYRFDPTLNTFGTVAGSLATLVEKGEYKQLLDDVSARLKQAESDLDASKERAAWAERSVKLKYLTPTQAKVETTKYASSQDAVEKLTKEKYILENFTRTRNLTDLKAKLDVARIGLDKAGLQAKSKEIQAESQRKTMRSVFDQEQDKLTEISEQISQCRLYSPQDGMVVYYKAESSRFGQSSAGMIAQGEQVKEGQKLMRIPDLHKMQVNTRVHEALVSKIKGDDRRPTGVVDALRAGMLTAPDGFARLVGQSDAALQIVRDHFRDKEYYIANPGQTAGIRVDALPDRVFAGRVRSVAAVAAQTDWMSADVKVYQTLVVLEGTVDGLKPDMNAEVTIHVDTATEPVLAVPMQAVVGGAEGGPERAVYVMTTAGPQERKVTLGKFNDKMIEVREGLTEGEDVILNPKAILGDKGPKTREEGETRGSKAAPGEKGGEKKGGGGMKKKGGAGAAAA